MSSGLSLVLSWAVRLSFWIGLWMLCLDIVTMTLGGDGDVELGFLVVRMVGGSWVVG